MKRAPRIPAAPPWLVGIGYKGTQILPMRKSDLLPTGTILQIDPPSMSRLCVWDGRAAAFCILLRGHGWRWALVLVRGTVLGEHLIARGQRGCPLDAKADLAHFGITVLP